MTSLAHIFLWLNGEIIMKLIYSRFKLSDLPLISCVHKKVKKLLRPKSENALTLDKLFDWLFNYLVHKDESFYYKKIIFHTTKKTKHIWIEILIKIDLLTK